MSGQADKSKFAGMIRPPPPPPGSGPPPLPPSGGTAGLSSSVEDIAGQAGSVPIVRHHHERWDGGGYPDGLSGENIPRLARVLAVADAYDAMTSDRPYRRAMRVIHAREELERGAGTQFDPAAVEAFMRCIDEGRFPLD